MKNIIKFLALFTATLLIVTGCADSKKEVKEPEEKKEKEVEATILDAYEIIADDIEDDGYTVEIAGMEEYGEFTLYVSAEEGYGFSFKYEGQGFYVQCGIDGETFVKLNGETVATDDTACSEQIVNPFMEIVDEVGDIVEDFEDYDVDDEDDEFILYYDDPYDIEMDVIVAKDSSYIELVADEATEFTRLRILPGIDLPY